MTNVSYEIQFKFHSFIYNNCIPYTFTCNIYELTVLCYLPKIVTTSKQWRHRTINSIQFKIFYFRHKCSYQNIYKSTVDTPKKETNERPKEALNMAPS